MSESSLQSLQSTLNAIPDAEVRPPDLPVAVALQEAHDLWALLGQEGVAERLAAVGVGQESRDALEAALDAAREAQSQWVVVRDRRKSDAQKERELAGTELRSEIVAACRWNLRADRVAQGTLNAIQEGDGLADLVQDLLDLAHLVASRQGSFELDQTFDAAAQAEAARSLSGELEAGISAERLDLSQDEAINQRDRAYTHLDDQVNDIRAAGRYAFRGDADTQSRFSSAYLRRLRRARNKQATATPEGAAA